MLDNLSGKDNWEEALGLINGSSLQLPLKVNLTLLLYNGRKDEDPAKATILTSLAETCLKEGQLGIMQKNLENIERISAKWKLNREERLALYRKCADLLAQSKNELGAFRVLKSYADKVDVKKVTDDDKEQLRKCVLYGVKVPEIT